jgi:hypothetical protein
LDGLVQAGHAIDEATVYKRFLGRSLAAVQSVLRAEYGFELSAERLEAMRLRLFERFRLELKPMPGIVKTLESSARRW